MTCDVIEHFKLSLDVIDYMHISDNNARFDSHLLPGHGSIDWETLGLLMTQFGGAAMLELFFPLGMMQMELNAGLKSQLQSFLQTS
jgi:sugar phosphate isomerase/epimerase